MKIFDYTSHPQFGDKVNFVDANNVMVGFDLEQCCCESANWFVGDKVDFSEGRVDWTVEQKELEPYNFDPAFFERDDPDWLDSGGIVAFRLTAPDRPDLFLHLYNSQNGWYSHGFDMVHNGETIQSGSL